MDQVVFLFKQNKNTQQTVIWLAYQRQPSEAVDSGFFTFHFFLLYKQYKCVLPLIPINIWSSL